MFIAILCLRQIENYINGTQDVTKISHYEKKTLIRIDGAFIKKLTVKSLFFFLLVLHFFN